MKKIYIMLMCVLLMLPMALVGHAEMYNGVRLPVLPQGVTNAMITQYNEEYYLFTDYQRLADSNLSIKISSGTSAKQYDSNTNEWAYVSFGKSQYHNVVWANYDVKNTDGSGTVVLYGTQPKPEMCDGSTCPLVDADQDYICDECGFPVAYSLRAYPSFADLMTDGYVYATIYEGSTGEIRLHLSKEPSQHRTEGPEEGYVGIKGPNMEYRLNQEDWTWGFAFSNESGSQIYDTQFKGSNHDILDYVSGEVWSEANFPQPPLWILTQTGVDQTLIKAVQEILGVMKIMMVCGIGCLALLILLALFGKRSLIFLR